MEEIKINREDWDKPIGDWENRLYLNERKEIESLFPFKIWVEWTKQRTTFCITEFKNSQKYNIQVFRSKQPLETQDIVEKVKESLS